VEPKAHHILIGIFTLVLTALAIGFTLWLGKSTVDKNGRPFDIVFNESVTGLAVGSDVLYNGIRMGEVTRLTLDDKDPRKVWARIKVNPTTPVTEDTTARLTIANITGAAIIQLIAGNPESPLLVATSDSIPRIKASPSPFRQLRTSSEELLANIQNLVGNARDILSEENTDRIKNILANLEAGTEVIASEKEEMAEIIRSLNTTAQSLPNTVDRVNALLAKLDHAIENQDEGVMGDARATMRAVEKLSKDLDTLVTSNQSAVNQGLSEVAPLLNELRQTISSLGQITQQLEEDPAGFILGNEKIREYQR
jgi:phospholipid/cholesterol/gamma-HCH transport system substrate-binding protein